MNLLNPNPSVDSPIIVSWWGASKTKYDFQLHPIGVRYDARAGVYIFCKLAPNLRWDAVYVGETNDFSGRIADDLPCHHNWQSIRAAGATHICTLHVPGDDALRLRIETDLRHGLTPPCNRQ